MPHDVTISLSFCSNLNLKRLSGLGPLLWTSTLPKNTLVTNNKICPSASWFLVFFSDFVFWGDSYVYTSSKLCGVYGTMRIAEKPGAAHQFG